ncbi:hypothetical protein LAV82_23580 [Bacillus sp. ILBB4]|nr:hypothetical protein [Bacillus sp. ILBB4]
MELVTAYLYNRIPVETNDINVKTFHHLKRNGWYTDARTNKKFTMLNKRIEIDDQWYRVMIRFEYNGFLEGEDVYLLSLPCPFLITKCQPVEGISSARWKDTEVYHGPKLGSVLGFLQKGVPSAIIDEVSNDLKQYVQYN